MPYSVIKSISNDLTGSSGFTDDHSGLDYYMWAVVPRTRAAKNSDFSRVSGKSLFKELLKVTVQFEIEGNGQNEILSHMDRSETKL